MRVQGVLLGKVWALKGQGAFMARNSQTAPGSLTWAATATARHLRTGPGAGSAVWGGKGVSGLVGPGLPGR